MSMFNDPSSSDHLNYDELLGTLLLFTVDEETDEIQTVHGPQTAIRCSVVALDGDLAGQMWEDAMVFPRVLKSQLRRSVGGQMVVGRLAQGQKKPGQNPPWTLDAASDEEKLIAQKFVENFAPKVTAAPSPSESVERVETPF